jgi:hypothetical protein
MASFPTTNLGEQAQATRLIAQGVSALNYQQPFIAQGSLAVPLPAAALINQIYDPAYNKYVFYITTAATTVAISQTIALNQFVENFVGLYTITASADWVLTGTAPAFTVSPIMTTNVAVTNDTVVPSLGSSVILTTFSTTSATYSSGAALLKIVININLD